MSAKLCVPAGAFFHDSAGEVFFPVHPMPLNACTSRDLSVRSEIAAAERKRRTRRRLRRLSAKGTGAAECDHQTSANNCHRASGGDDQQCASNRNWMKPGHDHAPSEWWIGTNTKIGVIVPGATAPHPNHHRLPIPATHRQLRSVVQHRYSPWKSGCISRTRERFTIVER